jgi:hypothetical protein
MLVKNFGRLMRNDQFRKKFSEKMKKAPRESELEDPIGLRCFECSGFRHIQADCRNLSKEKGRHTMRLSVMSLKKKNCLSKKNVKPLWLHM